MMAATRRTHRHALYALAGLALLMTAPSVARAQTSSSFTCNATPGTVLDLTGGVVANGVTTYTSTNGVVVTSNVVNYSNTLGYYYLGLLFNNSTASAHTAYWLTSANATLTITLPQPTPIDQVRVLSVTIAADRLTNYRIYADKNGTLVEVTNGASTAGADTTPTWRSHGVYAAGVATTNKIVITTEKVSTYSAINEVQLVLGTCSTLPPCPTTGTDVTLGNCELTPGSLSFDGLLTIDGPLVAPTRPWSVDLSADSVVMTTNGSLNLNGFGDAALRFGVSGSGAAHGGRAGGETGSIYGSIVDPTTLGGGFSSSPGGGHVTIRARTGSMILDGAISADAAAPNGSCAYDGGAGGSVRLIAADAIGGIGSVSARGAGTCDATRRAGGGGRIAVMAASELPGSTLFQNLRASGGAGTLAGGAGTVFTQIGAAKGLWVDNFGITGASTPFQDSDRTALGSGWDLDVMRGATLNRWGNADLALGALYVGSGGVLTHEYNSSAKTNALSITAQSAEIASGGRIHADERGFGPQLGNAPGGAAAVGGSHGGLGGRQTAEVTYGNFAAPDAFGSGGYGTTAGGRGGGAIRLRVSGTLTLNGAISANGGGGTTYSNAGGGAGGSVWVTTQTLAGSTGTVNAIGGTGANDGAGGGGRIAIEYANDTSTLLPSPSAPTVVPNLSARGAYHPTQATTDSAGPGTIFIRDTDEVVAADPLASCSPGSQVLTSTGATQSFVVPTGCTTVQVKMWGGGGGGFCWTGNGGCQAGGGAGHTTGYLTTTPGETLSVIVGGPGLGGVQGTAKTGGFGGGGGTGSLGFGGSGGGRSAIRRGAIELATAGGGGGAGASNGGTVGGSYGGAGGGLTGENGGNPANGLGGTQTAGGTGAGGNGSAFQGGTPSGGDNGGGGGGGGGYFGGGAGSNANNGEGGGGGGSGYIGGMLSEGAWTTGGSRRTPAMTSDAVYASAAGEGGLAISGPSGDGKGGRVVISWGPTLQPTGGPGYVIVDNGDNPVDPYTVISKTGAEITLNHLVIARRARVAIPAGNRITLAPSGTLVPVTSPNQTRPVLSISGTLATSSATWVINGLDVSLESGGVLSTPVSPSQSPFDLTIRNAAFDFVGTLSPAKPRRLEIGAGALFTRFGTGTIALDDPATAAADDGTLVVSAGVLTHEFNTSARAHALDIVAKDIQIDAAGSIHANERGFGPQLGTGPGSVAAVGGSHGGPGGRQTAEVSYGNFAAPDTFGSGGYGTAAGGRGGGAIRLRASGTLTVNGQLSANGGGGTTYSNAGGGAGGSVWVTTQTLAGTTGLIAAIGGTGANDGAGGGGRVAIEYADNKSALLPSPTAPNVVATLSAKGATHPTQPADSGGAGTVYVRDSASGGAGYVIVDNANNGSNLYTVISKTGAVTLEHLVVARRARVWITAGNRINLAPGGTVVPVTNAGQSRPVLALNGTLATSSPTWVIDGLDVSLNSGGVLSTPTSPTQSPFDLTLRNSTFDLVGTFSPAKPQRLEIGAGTTFTRYGVAAIALDDPATAAVDDGTLFMSAGVLTHAPNSSTRSHALEVVAKDILIDAPASINVDGLGFTLQTGPGAGQTGSFGGSHGGLGGRQTGLVTYGSYRMPVDLGSSGYGTGSGGAGGGAVKLTASNLLRINGTVRANGLGGGTYSGAGGGAGGSVWLVANRFAGGGTLLAEGGTGANDGAGGGGRIAVWFNTNESTMLPSLTAPKPEELTRISAKGATHPTQPNDSGSAGTLYLLDQDGGGAGTLVIANANNTNSPQLLTPFATTAGTYEFDQVAMFNRGHLRIPAGVNLQLRPGGLIHTANVAAAFRPYLIIQGILTPAQTSTTIRWLDVNLLGTLAGTTQLTLEQTNFYLQGLISAGLSSLSIGAGAFVEKYGTGRIEVLGAPGKLTVLSGGTLTHAANAGVVSHVLDIKANDIDVQTGGKITADARGYGRQAGPGASATAAIGGSHGGLGGRASTGTYGDYRAPTTLGSGGNRTDLGGQGGGAIKLEALATLRVDGLVTANGAGGGTTANAGGGAGGSVWLLTNILEGNGTVLAQGGHLTNDGAGGGGRIAIEFNNNYSAFTPPLATPYVSAKLSARGGKHTTVASDSGGAGTIFLRDRDGGGSGTLLMDNEDNGTALQTPLVFAPGTNEIVHQLDHVALCRRGHLRIPQYVKLELRPGGQFQTACAATPLAVTKEGRSMLRIDGTFRPPLTAILFKSMDVTLAGTIENAVDVTVEASTMQLIGTFEDPLSKLTVSAGGLLQRYGLGSVDVLAGEGLLRVMSQGQITHAPNTDAELNSVNFRAKDIDIQAGGSIVVDGQGYGPMRGPGAGTVDGYAASHGGWGGRQTNDKTYGDFRAPNTSGSGGEHIGADGFNPLSLGGAGGGHIRLEAQDTIKLNGLVSANGAPGKREFHSWRDSGWYREGYLGGTSGAGGSLSLRATKFEGSGSLQARGGEEAATTGGGGGGGGRIALRYKQYAFPALDTLVSASASVEQLTARGGYKSNATSYSGGSGTIFLQDEDDDPDGVLVIDNANNPVEVYTPLKTVGSTVKLSKVVLKNRGNLQVPTGITLELPKSSPFLSIGAVHPNLRIDSGATYRAKEILLDNIDLFNYGRLEGIQFISFRNSIWTQQSTNTDANGDILLGHDVAIGEGAILEVGGTLPLKVTGTFTLRDNAVARHFANTATAGTAPAIAHQLWLKANKVDVQSAAAFDVSGRGYSRGAGPGFGAGGNLGQGGGHGGAGGAKSNSTTGPTGGAANGVREAPISLGSGGGDDSDVAGTGGEGGGLVRIEACEEVRVDGAIRANGIGGEAHDGGGGSGGTVRIATNLLVGTGTISARGGNGSDTGGTAGSGGGGGGGRVALSFQNKTLANNPDVSGGASPAYGGSAGTYYENATLVSACAATPCGVGPCAGTPQPDGSCDFSATNGADCSDGSLCTLEDTCNQGLCVSGSPKSCNDNNDCTVESCDPFKECVRTTRTGTCDDRNACTLNTTCAGEVCGGGTLRVCEDSNGCTDNLCDPSSGCKYPAVEAGTACDDDESCTSDDACEGTACMGVAQEVPGCYDAFPGDPVIGPHVADILVRDGASYTLDLTAYENDFESGPAADNNQLTWSVVDYDPGMISVKVGADDVLTITPKTSLVSFALEFVLRLKDGSGRTDEQLVVFQHELSDYLLTVSATPNPAMPNADRVMVKAKLTSPVGLPVVGRAIGFSLDVGDGKLFPPSRLTDANGEAEVALLPGRVSPHVIRATYNGTYAITATHDLVVSPPEKDAAIYVNDIEILDPDTGLPLDVSQMGAVLPDQPLTLRAKIRNVGLTATPSLLVSFSSTRLSPEALAPEAPLPLGTAVAPAIAPAGTTTVTVDTTLTQLGFHVLTVVVDPNDTFLEGNERNNRATAGFWIGLPDTDLDPATEGLELTCELHAKTTGPTGAPSVKPGQLIGVSGRAQYAALRLADPTGELGYAAVRGGVISLALEDDFGDPVVVSKDGVQHLPTSGAEFPPLHTYDSEDEPEAAGHFPNRSADDIWDVLAPDAVGCYTLRVCADDASMGGCCAQQFCVVPDGPELTCTQVEAITYDEEGVAQPATVAVDAAVTLTTTLKNTGGFAATQVTVQQVLNDQLVGLPVPISEVGAIAQGGEVPWAADWTPACGTKNVGFEVKWGSDIPGDTLVRSVRCVSAMPDAVATKLETQASASGGCMVDIELTHSMSEMKGLKAASIRPVFEITEPSGTLRDPSVLGPGTPARLAVTDVLLDAAGVYTIKAILDGSVVPTSCGNVPELEDVSNNVLTVELCGDASPNPSSAGLSGTPFTFSPEAPLRYGKEVTVKAKVYNGGLAPINVPIEVSLTSAPSGASEVGEALIGTIQSYDASCEAHPIAPRSASDELTWTWTPTYPLDGSPEHRALRLVVDGQQALPGCKTAKAPDLAVFTYQMNLGIQASPTGIVQLDADTTNDPKIALQITHAGNLLPAGGEFRTRLEVVRADGSRTLHVDEVVEKPADSELNFPHARLIEDWNLTAADCNPDNPVTRLEAKVDSENGLLETNENDNLATVNLPDLVPTAVTRRSVTDTTVANRACLSTMWLTVSDLAKAPALAAGSWTGTVRVIAPDGSMTDVPISGTGAGEFPLAGTFDTNLTGTYIFDIRIDTANDSACGHVLEANEKNNRIVKTLTLCADPSFESAASLRVVDASGAPIGAVQQGVPFSVKATVKNLGSLPLTTPFNVILSKRIGTLSGLESPVVTVTPTCADPIAPQATVEVTWSDVVLSPEDSLDMLMVAIDNTGLTECSSQNNSAMRYLWQDLSPWTSNRAANYSRLRDIGDKVTTAALNWGGPAYLATFAVRMLEPTPYIRDPFGERISSPIKVYPPEASFELEYAFVRADQTRQVFGQETFEGAIEDYGTLLDLPVPVTADLCLPLNPIQSVNVIVDSGLEVAESVETNQKTSRPFPNLKVAQVTRKAVRDADFDINFSVENPDFREFPIGKWKAKVSVAGADGSVTHLTHPAAADAFLSGPRKASASGKPTGSGFGPILVTVPAPVNGPYAVTVTADPNSAEAPCGSVPERNESDNAKTSPTWYLCPELAIRADVKAEPDSTDMTATITLRNTGLRTLAERVTVIVEAVDADGVPVLDTDDGVPVELVSPTSTVLDFSATALGANKDSADLVFTYTPPQDPTVSVAGLKVTATVEDTNPTNGPFPTYALCSQGPTGDAVTGNVRSIVAPLPLVSNETGCSPDCVAGDASCTPCDDTPDPTQIGCELALKTTALDVCSDALGFEMTAKRPLGGANVPSAGVFIDAIASVSQGSTALGSFRPDFQNNNGTWEAAIDDADLGAQHIGASVRLSVQMVTPEGHTCFTERSFIVTGSKSELALTTDNITFIALTTQDGTVEESFTQAHVGDLATIGMTVSNLGECPARDVMGSAYIDLGYAIDGEPQQTLLGYWWIDEIPAEGESAVSFYYVNDALDYPIVPSDDSFDWRVGMPSPWFQKITLEANPPDTAPIIAQRALQVGDFFALQDVDLVATIEDPPPDSTLLSGEQTFQFKLRSAEGGGYVIPSGAFSSPTLEEDAGTPVEPESLESLVVLVYDQDNQPIGEGTIDLLASDAYDSDGLYQTTIDLTGVTAGDGFTVSIQAVMEGNTLGSTSGSYLLGFCEDNDGDGELGFDSALCPTGTDCDDTNPTSTLRSEDADCDGVPTAQDCDDLDPTIDVACNLECLLETPTFDPALSAAALVAEDCALGTPKLVLTVVNEGSGLLDDTLSVALFETKPEAGVLPFDVFTLAETTVASGTLPIAAGETSRFLYEPAALPSDLTSLYVVLNHAMTTPSYPVGSGWRTAGEVDECQTTDNDAGPIVCDENALLPGQCFTVADCAPATDACDTVNCVDGLCVDNDLGAWQTCEELNKVYVAVANGTDVGYLICTRTLGLGGKPTVDCERNPDGTVKVVSGPTGGLCAAP